MKLKELLNQLNQLAKKRPEALEMEVKHIDTIFEEAISCVMIKNSRRIGGEIINIEEPFILLE